MARALLYQQLPLFPLEKCCTKCGVLKPFSQFHWRGDRGDLRSACKPCTNIRNRAYAIDHKDGKAAYARIYYRAHREHYLELGRRWHQANPGARGAYKRYYARNAEQRRAYRRAYYQEHADAQRAYRRRYHTMHRMEECARARSYRLAHPEKYSEYGARRRWRKKHQRIGRVSYREILERDGLVCHLCGGAIDPSIPRELHFDHVIPLARGGPHSAENIRPSHGRCNQAKSARLP